MGAVLAGMGMQAAGQAASQAISNGMGLLFAKPNRNAQLKTQKALQNLQIEGQKEMTDYSQAAALKMWHDTGYGAQKEQMKEAGINPALMYGMGGGGGQTANLAQGSVAGGQAQNPASIGVAMAEQLGLMKAQRPSDARHRTC